MDINRYEYIQLILPQDLVIHFEGVQWSISLFLNFPTQTKVALTCPNTVHTQVGRCFEQQRRAFKALGGGHGENPLALSSKRLKPQDSGALGLGRYLNSEQTVCKNN